MSILNGRRTFRILPTGFGKSFFFSITLLAIEAAQVRMDKSGSSPIISFGGFPKCHSAFLTCPVHGDDVKWKSNKKASLFSSYSIWLNEAWRLNNKYCDRINQSWIKNNQEESSFDLTHLNILRTIVEIKKFQIFEPLISSLSLNQNVYRSLAVYLMMIILCDRLAVLIGYTFNLYSSWILIYFLNGLSH